MKIAIGTTNRAKINAVKTVISGVWTDAEFVSVEVESGVKPQPLTDDEGILGATNRANRALANVAGAAYGVGLEGAVQENQYGMFLCGWAVITDGKGTAGIGSSGRVLIPKFMKDKLKIGKELGLIIQEFTKDTNNEIRHTTGAFGVLTNGLITRTGALEGAVKMALAVFISPEMYKNPKM